MNTPRNGSTREWRRKRARILSAPDLICGSCGDPIDRTLRWPNPLSPTVDHKNPRALGGTDALSNLQPMHLRCNLRKSDKTGPVELHRSPSLRRPPS